MPFWAQNTGISSGVAAPEGLHRRVHVIRLDGADDDVTLPERDGRDVRHRRHPENVVAVDAAKVEATPG